MPFKSLGLPKYLQKTTDTLAYDAPTAIQVQAIPFVLKERDIIAVAQTGTGKTAAFALPIIKRVCERPVEPVNESVLVLVVTPTRELALQVASAFRSYTQFAPQKVGIISLIGGEDIGNQIRGLSRGVEIIVATPGRLLDLIDRGEVHLDKVQTLVLDEADKLLDLGFAEDLDTLLEQLPSQRQNLLFSATFPAKVAALSSRFLVDPLHITVEGQQPVVERIAQRVIQVDRHSRRMLLLHLLDKEEWNQVLVFVATKVAARNLANKLHRDGIMAAEFHGDLEQHMRVEALKLFKSGHYQVLVATDVAARGIDINKLSCVVNYDLPRSPRDYIHRIGRTGRAGHSGVAISFIDHDSAAHFALIEKRADIKLVREQVEGFEMITKPTRKAKGPEPTKGRRRSKKDRLREKVAQTKELHPKALQTKELHPKELQTKELQTKELQTKEPQTKEPQTKELQTKELHPKELQTKELQTKGD